MPRVSKRALTPWQRFNYTAFRCFTRVAAPLLFHLRTHGRQWAPSSGGALICSNHQSYFDPVLVGQAFDRRLNYLARKALFQVPVLAPAIRHLDAIPVDRDGGGASGWKETLRRLKLGELVLVFPEGTRTRDGRVAPFKPGFTMMARRTRTPLVPVAIDGAFQALPRGRLVPSFPQVCVEIGPPLTPDEAAEMSDEELVAEVERRVRDCHDRAHSRRLRALGRPG